MSNYRRETGVMRSGGSAGGAVLWPILLLTFTLFWPLMLHGTGKVIASAIWYGLMCLAVISLFGIYIGEKIYIRQRVEKLRRAEALLDRWDPPDLRKSGVFEGEWN